MQAALAAAVHPVPIGGWFMLVTPRSFVPWFPTYAISKDMLFVIARWMPSVQVPTYGVRRLRFTPRPLALQHPRSEPQPAYAVRRHLDTRHPACDHKQHVLGGCVRWKPRHETPGRNQHEPAANRHRMDGGRESRLHRQRPGLWQLLA